MPRLPSPRHRSLALGLSQVELARKVGIGEQCIGRYERRQQEPSLSTFLAWVQTLYAAVALVESTWRL